MSRAVPISELVVALERGGLDEAVSLDEPIPPGHRAVIRGSVELDGRRLGLRLWIPSNFPLSLPPVLVEDHEGLGFVPHLTSIGSICYHEGEGSVQSIWRPAMVVVEAMKLALDTLRESLAVQGGAGEIVEEMEWWWSRQRGCWQVWTSVFEPGKQVKLVRCVNGVVVGNKDALDLPGVINERGLYLPLEHSLVDEHLDPPRLLDPEHLRELVWAHLSEDNHKLLRKRLRDASKRGQPPRFVVLGVPRPSGDHALIVARFNNGELTPHPLETKAMKSTSQIEPILVDRSDRRRLLERGGANPKLQSKRVTVVGVGAVGGYVAEAIARTGIGVLSLIDPDMLEPANMYRHTLGSPRLSQVLPVSPLLDGNTPLCLPVFKAEAMARHIRSGLPYVDVQPVPNDVMNVLDELVRSADLVIVAVGSPTLSRGLNLELRAREGPRAIYTWLEPLGIGGHALLTAPAGQAGCYECLFVDENGDERLSPRTDFVVPNQDVLSRVGGCGMSYTPFSDLDARRTAELAARLAVEALTSARPGPCLRSWRGEASAARARELELSERYDRSQDQLDAELETFVDNRCRICVDE